VSLGLMEDAAASSLRAAGVDFVNHNLNTSRRFYPEICSTHTYDDRLATVGSAKRAGLKLCSGVIVGMGETDDDLVDVALELGRLEPVSLPVNFLIPIEGTPLGEPEPPPLGRCLRALAVFRLTNPRAEIRAAGGRERALGDAQPLALYPANSIFMDGYLTTPGQQREAAVAMIAAHGFDVDAGNPPGDELAVRQRRAIARAPAAWSEQEVRMDSSANASRWAREDEDDDDLLEDDDDLGDDDDDLDDEDDDWDDDGEEEEDE